MAREELAYTGREWKDFQDGGTRINADDLNNMEGGIANMTAAINKVNATVLTYIVASAGDTATTDINGAPITGPCYVEDLSNGNRWLDKGDGTARVRTGVSVAEYEALRDSVDRRIVDDIGGTIFQHPQTRNVEAEMLFKAKNGDSLSLMLFVNNSGGSHIGIWNNTTKKGEWTL